MEGRDGWHVASFQATTTSNKTIINPVMLRFRPIAPKPVTGGSYTADNNTSSILRPTKRVKRKYVRVRRDINNKKDKNPRRSTVTNNNGSSGLQEGETTTTVTLQLLPEKSDGRDLNGGTGCGAPGSWMYCTAVQDNNDNNKLMMNDNNYNPRKAAGDDEVLDRRGAAAVESWVTVESVTDTCMDVRGLGCTDVERIKNLEKDTCPGFVTDGYFSRVEWVNGAFKKMVVEEEEEAEMWWPEVVVWLVVAPNNNNNNKYIKNNNDNNRNSISISRTELGLMGPAFTCRVRVQFKRANNCNYKEVCSKIMPCDVYRMDCGGFAWRLDVKAALSLVMVFDSSHSRNKASYRHSNSKVN
ncbi:hypothetical protein F8388_010351 [Cannabis sativa]|uniref:DUF7950 domain-containing protein n=1 Tax=Cannabis sativa TaxID=3483 RepID=A0A7J6GS99_CANSA|nr:hypothetical protein F8388_010351 [Cannabis sativa]